ncbi:alpha/beta hydrolase [Piscinibacter gummiphilus]|uniref:Lysophospholipase n=1 Tax=Piscinibacter gummiphilus TaxID=946333 RepID=A0ABZ0CYS2_9BURK|nr:alpha/beta hydrolase [Piscinibacter gummiphilus]WOB08023.1 lysophospholipase [Piscinibacter gummiphilus]
MTYAAPYAAITTPDGQRLHLQAWPAPDPAAARGTVLIVHGLGEHIGRYAHVAKHLNASGWHVVGYDHRGHGRSDGPKGKINTADDLLRDLSLVIDHVRAQQPGLLVLLGHSMGGLVAARFVGQGVARPGEATAEWHRPIDALVLSSPALAADTNAVQKLLLATLGTLAPDLAVNNGLKPEWISRDPKVVAAYTADPLVHDRITPRLARFILGNGEWVRLHAARWKVPTLLMYAGSDRCVAPSGSRDFAATVPKPVLTAKEFGPLYHEIFNEPEQGEVLATLSSWLQSLKGPAA